METYPVAVFQHVQDTVPLQRWLPWEQIAAVLTKHTARKSKGGQLFSPVFYAPNSTRKIENVKQVAMFVMDIDDGTDPSAFHAWGAYPHLVYSTYSSTPEKPKYRAVFPLAANVMADQWPAVWERCLHTLGRDAEGTLHADPVCKDATRLYYLPTCPEDATPFAYVHEGVEFLDPAKLPAPPPPPKVVAAAPVAPTEEPDLVSYRGEGDRPAASYLVERALAKVDLSGGVGRNYCCMWLACALRDNGYSPEEATPAIVEFAARVPQMNTKGEPSRFDAADGLSVLTSVYKRPSRGPWKRSTAFSDQWAEVEAEDAADGAAGDRGAAVTVSAPPHDDAEAPPEKGLPKPAVYTAAELQHKEIPPITWIVPNLVPEGGTILVGHSKVGKSFVVGSIAGGVALGGMALGSIAVEKGDVLYLALEDGQRRMKSRFTDLFEMIDPWPDNLHVAHEWPPLGPVGLLTLRVYLEEHPATRLVVIDTWNAVRPAHGKNGDLVKEDYDAFSYLSKLGLEHHCGILIVHHMAQHTKNDEVNAGATTHGAPAAVEAVLNFTRARREDEAILATFGKDVIESQFHLARDTRTGFWTLSGTEAQVQASKAQQAVFDVLQTLGPSTNKQIAGALGKSGGCTWGVLKRMVDAKLLAMDGENRYYRPEPELF